MARVIEDSMRAHLCDFQWVGRAGGILLQAPRAHRVSISSSYVVGLHGSHLHAGLYSLSDKDPLIKRKPHFAKLVILVD